MKQTIAIALTLIVGMMGQSILAQTKKAPRPTPRTPMKIEKPALAVALKKVKISGFTLNNMTVEDAFKYLSAEYAKASGKGRGINFLYKCSKEVKNKKISLDLSASSIPASDVIYYICLQAGMNHRMDDFVVVLWQLKAKEGLNRY